MGSIGDSLRREDLEAAARMSPAERLELALALGRRDVEAYCRSHGVDPRTAIRVFERQRQAGRTASRCMMEIIG
ncbi:MAG: hypothetical protein JOZ15_22110 [Acidobacteria bacterium]|nr:hypothetical protein [Acidobacteriota bacterium]